MSINSSLVKLADKIDADGASNVSPEYKNPNNSVEKSLERIADNYEASGGGGGSGALIVHATASGDTYTLTKTWQEIYDAFEAGKPIYLDPLPEEMSLTYGRIYFHSAVIDKAGYTVIFGGANGTPFIANNAEGYPVASA